MATSCVSVASPVATKIKIQCNGMSFFSSLSHHSNCFQKVLKLAIWFTSSLDLPWVKQWGNMVNNNGCVTVWFLSLLEIIWPRLTVLPVALVRCPIISGGGIESFNVLFRMELQWHAPDTVNFVGPSFLSSRAVTHSAWNNNNNFMLNKRFLGS